MRAMGHDQARRRWLAFLLLPWHVAPAFAQVRTVPVESPVIGTPVLAPTAAVQPSAPLALPDTPLATSLLATPAPLLQPLAGPLAEASSGRLAQASALPVARAGRTATSGPTRSPSRKDADGNRFRTPGLLRVLAELASFGAPAAPEAVLALGRPAEPREGELRPTVEPAGAHERERIPAPRRRWLRDAWLYSQIYLSSLYWYTGPRLVERWAEIQEKLRATPDKPRAVKDIKGFFIAHRVLGSTGNYSPLGFRVASQRLVVHDALAIYDRYFIDDEKARAAFLGLMQRAERYNPNRRSTQFRKALFHALREASVLEPSRVADFFDSQLGRKKAAELERYQRDEQPKVLAAFATAVNEVIVEMNRSAEPGSRVVGALLLGSFANGAAGPGSDLDVQAISEDGSARANEEFVQKLKARWKQESWSDSPVSTFQYALPMSKPLIARVHREPYLIYSPYAEVTASLMRTAEEERHDQPSRIRTARGWLFQQFYSGLLRVVLALHDLKERLKGY